MSRYQIACPSMSGRWKRVELSGKNLHRCRGMSWSSSGSLLSPLDRAPSALHRYFHEKAHGWVHEDLCKHVDGATLQEFFADMNAGMQIRIHLSHHTAMKTPFIMAEGFADLDRQERQKAPNSLSSDSPLDISASSISGYRAPRLVADIMTALDFWVPQKGVSIGRSPMSNRGVRESDRQ